MAKDGTRRGGARLGSGKKRAALLDKINKGQQAEIIDLPTPPDLVGEDMPPVKEFMTQLQHDGSSLCAEEVYTDTWNWLKNRGCEKLVNIQLVQQYAMSVGRWIQTEEAISKYGMLAKHPTSGNPIASPYVSMSQNYMKQTNQIWFQIYQIVRENCSTEWGGASPQDDVMDRLLRARKGNN